MKQALEVIIKDYQKIVGVNIGSLRHDYANFALKVVGEYESGGLSDKDLEKLADEIMFSENTINLGDDLMLNDIESGLCDLIDTMYLEKNGSGVAEVISTIKQIACDILDGYHYEQTGLLVAYYYSENVAGKIAKSISCTIKRKNGDIRVSSGSKEINSAVEKTIKSCTTLFQAKENMPRKIEKFKLHEAVISSVYPKDIVD